MAALAVALGDMDMVGPLGMAGIPVAVVAPEASSAFHSRHVRGGIRWPDYRTDQDGLIRRMLDLAAAQPAPPVLYYGADTTLGMVSRNRERLSRAFRFVIADADLVDDLTDKARFQALAWKLDLPVPRAVRLDPSPGIPRPELELDFPFIVKPLTFGCAWNREASGGGKARRIDDAGMLDRLWPVWAADGYPLLAQELIPGPESRIESYHVYVDRAGLIAGEFTGRKIRTYPADYGFSTAVTTTDAPDVAELGRWIVGRIGLRGVAKLDFKRAPDGRLFLLEVNPRFNLWHHLGAAAGVNLPALVHADLTGGPRPRQGPARAGICWCSLAGDWRAAAEAGMSRLSWLAWAARCGVTSELAIDDPMPFLRGYLMRHVRRRLSWPGSGRGAATPADPQPRKR